MIITKLNGGLGNQMFQYACGRAMAIRNKDALKLDISDFKSSRNSDTPRDYLLSHFNIQSDGIASPDEISAIKQPERTQLPFYNIGFVPRIMHKKGDAYLDGYWQTERYFADCAEAIRQDLSLRNPMGRPGQSMEEEIRGEPDSVSIHVRRGDVARDASTNPYAGVTTFEYYAKALECVGMKLKKPHVFIFSDDPKWVAENIRIPFPSTAVSGAGIPDYEEIVLMSLCKHHIIANSTFSWWGAWLDSRPDKIVVAPKRWIRRLQLRNPFKLNLKLFIYSRRHKDTVPKSWIRI